MDPVIYKEIIVAHSGKNFVNGKDEFDLTTADMDEMVKNFTANPRQVPILFRGEHALGAARADLPADGWVEGLKRIGADLVARVKFMGELAIAVMNDTFRNVSIGAFQKPDLHGRPVGWRLDHLLVTNAAFFSDTNIAARSSTSSGEMPLLYLTASKEATMPEPEKKEKKDPEIKIDDSMGLTEKVTALEIVVQEKNGQIRELTTKNEALVEEIKAFHERPDLALAQKEIAQLKLHNTAEKIRRITANLAKDNQIDMVELRGWYDHESDSVVLAGFKGSTFKGDLSLLEYHRSMVPKRPSRSFATGTPAGDGEGYTAEEQVQLRAAGKDPELLAKTRGASNYTEFKQRKAAATKG